MMLIFPRKLLSLFGGLIIIIDLVNSGMVPISNPNGPNPPANNRPSLPVKPVNTGGNPVPSVTVHSNRPGRPTAAHSNNGQQPVVSFGIMQQKPTVGGFTSSQSSSGNSQSHLIISQNGVGSSADPVLIVTSTQSAINETENLHNVPLEQMTTIFSTVLPPPQEEFNAQEFVPEIIPSQAVAQQIIDEFSEQIHMYAVPEADPSDTSNNPGTYSSVVSIQDGNAVASTEYTGVHNGQVEISHASSISTLPVETLAEQQPVPGSFELSGGSVVTVQEPLPGYVAPELETAQNAILGTNTVPESISIAEAYPANVTTEVSSQQVTPSLQQATPIIPYVIADISSHQATPSTSSVAGEDSSPQATLSNSSNVVAEIISQQTISSTSNTASPSEPFPVTISQEEIPHASYLPISSHDIIQNPIIDDEEPIFNLEEYLAQANLVYGNINPSIHQVQVEIVVKPVEQTDQVEALPVSHPDSLVPAPVEHEPAPENFQSAEQQAIEIEEPLIAPPLPEVENSLTQNPAEIVTDEISENSIFGTENAAENLTTHVQPVNPDNHVEQLQETLELDSSPIAPAIWTTDHDHNEDPNTPYTSPADAPTITLEEQLPLSSETPQIVSELPVVETQSLDIPPSQEINLNNSHQLSSFNETQVEGANGIIENDPIEIGIVPADDSFPLNFEPQIMDIYSMPMVEDGTGNDEFDDEPPFNVEQYLAQAALILGSSQPSQPYVHDNQHASANALYYSDKQNNQQSSEQPNFFNEPDKNGSGMIKGNQFYIHSDNSKLSDKPSSSFHGFGMEHGTNNLKEQPQVIKLHASTVDEPQASEEQVKGGKVPDKETSHDAPTVPAIRPIQFSSTRPLLGPESFDENALLTVVQQESQKKNESEISGDSLLPAADHSTQSHNHSDIPVSQDAFYLVTEDVQQLSPSLTKAEIERARPFRPGISRPSTLGMAPMYSYSGGVLNTPLMTEDIKLTEYGNLVPPNSKNPNASSSTLNKPGNNPSHNSMLSLLGSSVFNSYFNGSLTNISLPSTAGSSIMTQATNPSAVQTTTPAVQHAVLNNSSAAGSLNATQLKPTAPDASMFQSYYFPQDSIKHASILITNANLRPFLSSQNTEDSGEVSIIPQMESEAKSMQDDNFIDSDHQSILHLLAEDRKKTSGSSHLVKRASKSTSGKSVSKKNTKRTEKPKSVQEKPLNSSSKVPETVLVQDNEDGVANDSESQSAQQADSANLNLSDSPQTKGEEETDSKLDQEEEKEGSKFTQDLKEASKLTHDQKLDSKLTEEHKLDSKLPQEHKLTHDEKLDSKLTLEHKLDSILSQQKEDSKLNNEQEGSHLSKQQKEDSTLSQEQKLDSKLVEEQKLDSKLVEEQKLDSKLVEEQKLDSKLVEEQKLDSKLVEEQKLDSKLVEEQKLDSKLVEEQKLDSKLVEEQKLDSKLVEEQKLDSKLVEEQKDQDSEVSDNQFTEESKPITAPVQDSQILGSVEQPQTMELLTEAKEIENETSEQNKPEMSMKEAEDKTVEPNESSIQTKNSEDDTSESNDEDDKLTKESEEETSEANDDYTQESEDELREVIEAETQANNDASNPSPSKNSSQDDTNKKQSVEPATSKISNPEITKAKQPVGKEVVPPSKAAPSKENPPKSQAPPKEIPPKSQASSKENPPKSQAPSKETPPKSQTPSKENPSKSQAPSKDSPPKSQAPPKESPPKSQASPSPPQKDAAPPASGPTLPPMPAAPILVAPPLIEAMAPSLEQLSIPEPNIVYTPAVPPDVSNMIGAVNIPTIPMIGDGSKSSNNKGLPNSPAKPKPPKRPNTPGGPNKVQNSPVKPAPPLESKPPNSRPVLQQLEIIETIDIYEEPEELASPEIVASEEVEEHVNAEDHDEESTSNINDMEPPQHSKDSPLSNEKALPSKYGRPFPPGYGPGAPSPLFPNSLHSPTSQQNSASFIPAPVASTNATPEKGCSCNNKTADNNSGGKPNPNFNDNNNGGRQPSPPNKHNPAPTAAPSPPAVIDTDSEDDSNVRPPRPTKPKRPNRPTGGNKKPKPKPTDKNHDKFKDVEVEDEVGSVLSQQAVANDTKLSSTPQLTDSKIGNVSTANNVSSSVTNHHTPTKQTQLFTIYSIFGWEIPVINWSYFTDIFQSFFVEKFRTSSGEFTCDESESGVTILRSELDVDYLCGDDIDFDYSRRDIRSLGDSNVCNMFCNSNGYSSGVCMPQKSCLCYMSENKHFAIKLDRLEDFNNNNNTEKGASDSEDACHNCRCLKSCQNGGKYVGYCSKSCHCGVPWYNEYPDQIERALLNTHS